jgi:FG-GAP-like repeat
MKLLKKKFLWISLAGLLLLLAGCGGGSGDSGAAGSGGSGSGGGGPALPSGNATGGVRNPVCTAGQSSGEVQRPQYRMHLEGQTSWYASPVVADLDGDGKNELIAAYYSVYVFDDQGQLLDRVDHNGGRVYAPHVVADLEGDGIVEVVFGADRWVHAYEWRDGRLQVKNGWPADTTTAGESPEVRGLAAADLDGDGLIEVVATTTQTQPTENGGAQVFVFSPDGSLFQPGGLSYPAWPRYNNLAGAGGDADRNGMGHSGFGCYGLNVGIGNIDDDSDLEVIVTYDNHHIQAFDPNGVAINASDWFTNRDSAYSGQCMTWGQFIRWADPQVEEDHYHLHTGEWPNPGNGQEWLQWTASPPNIVDLDGDGLNEVLGVPNVELYEPYETQAYALMVLEGAHGDGSRSAMRKAGWETLPRGGAPISVSGWYPPNGVPAAVTLDIQGDSGPEIVVSLNDGFMRAFTAQGAVLWSWDYTHQKAVMYASEATVADLNQDGSPEILFATYGAPDVQDSGYLVILGADGSLLHDIALPNPGYNGNGNGAPAAPAVGDLDGDGQLEIFVQTFDHGMDVFTVPGSGANCLPWPTARGGPLRMGQPNANHF